jgi:Flp pilus assembly protein TadG
MRRHGQRGSGLPEMAIVATALLALMFGIIDFGRAMYTYSFVAQLARSGARWAIVRGSGCTVLDHCNASSANVQTYVQSLSLGMMNASRITATLGLPNNGCQSAGCPVVVTVTYPFSFMTGVLPSASFNMSSSSQMVISQ